MEEIEIGVRRLLRIFKLKVFDDEEIVVISWSFDVILSLKLSDFEII